MKARAGMILKIVSTVKVEVEVKLLLWSICPVVARKKMKPLWSHLVFYGNLVFLVIHSKTSENYFKHQMTILLIEENECLHINELLER